MTVPVHGEDAAHDLSFLFVDLVIDVRARAVIAGNFHVFITEAPASSDVALLGTLHQLRAGSLSGLDPLHSRSVPTKRKKDLLLRGVGLLLFVGQVVKNADAALDDADYECSVARNVAAKA
ncbi:MAG TPA: hypothetical protein VHI32_00725 [Burkholderiales bacterium]|nr:hypothetical protein [Burkholderiales bacterium]